MNAPLATIVTISSLTLNFALVVSIICVSHEWGITKGRQMNEIDHKVKPIGVRYQERSE